MCCGMDVFQHIDDLQSAGVISLQLYQILRRNKLECLAEVAKLYSLHVIEDMRDMTGRCFEELKGVLASCPGVSFNGSLIILDNPYGFLSESERAIADGLFLDTMTEERQATGWVQRLYSSSEALFNGIWYQDFYRCFYDSDLSVSEHIDRATFLLDYLSALQERMVVKNKKQDWVGKLCSDMTENLKSCLVEIPFYCLSKGVITAYGRWFLDRKLDMLNNRSHPPVIYRLNAKDELLTVSSLLFIEMTDYWMVPETDNLKKQHKQVLEALVKEFKPFFYEAIQLSDVELRLKYLQEVYSFLNDENAAFVHSFYQQKGYLPLFFMAYQQLIDSGYWPFSIYSEAHGLGDGICHAIPEVAEKEVFWSEDEISRMLSKGLRRDRFSAFSLEDSSHYEWLFNRLFWTDQSPELIQLAREERLPEDFSRLSWLLRAILDCKIYMAKKKRILVNKKVSWGSVSWPLLFEGCEFLSKKSMTVNDCLRVLKYQPEQEKEAKALVRHIGKEAYGLVLDEHDCFHIPERKSKSMKR